MHNSNDKFIHEARDAYHKKKWHDVLKLYLPHAEAGNTDAQIFVGWLYLKGGHGVEKNNLEAERWLSYAARIENPSALYLLGTLYYEVQEYAKAIATFKKAATLGYSAAAYQLGKMYKSGEVVDKDVKKAYLLYSSAADMGHVFAKREKAMMLIKGYQGTKNIPIGVLMFLQSLIYGVWMAFHDPYDELTFD